MISHIMDDEEYCRLHKDDHCFSWEFVEVGIFSKDFVLEFREYLHPKNINDFKQKWKRIDGIIKKFGIKFYMDVFDNYGYVDEW